MYRLKIKG